MSSPSAESVQQKISSQFEGLSPELQRAARWVVGHGAAMALNSMRDSARAAGVTPATMTRLAQRLGFDGFEALREPMRQQLSHGDADARSRRPAARQRPLRASAEGTAPLNRLQQANVASVLALNGAADIDAAARTVLAATQVMFFGLRVCHGVAFYLAYAYSLMRGNGSLLADDGGLLTDRLASLGQGSVLVALSHAPYTRRTVAVAEQARAQGASVVALTDSALSPLARGAAHVLLYDTASNAYFHSIAGAQAMAESLLAAVAQCSGAEATQYLRERQARLRSAGTYWDRPGDQE